MRILAIDLDGTIVDDMFPAIGPVKPGAKQNINRLYSEGYEIIIWTSRSHLKLLEAIEFLAKEGIKYHRINESSPANLMMYGSKDTRKIYADMYIDDRGLLNPMPHWDEIYELVHQRLPLYSEIVAEEGFL